MTPAVYADRQIDNSNLWPAIYTETITITSAQILDLFDTRVELVATPGDGSVILPIAANVSLVGVGTPYATNINVTILGQNASPASQYWGIFQIDSGSDTDFQVKSAVASGARLYEDQSLYVQAQTGDPTAGDADMIISVWYQLLYP